MQQALLSTLTSLFFNSPNVLRFRLDVFTNLFETPKLSSVPLHEILCLQYQFGIFGFRLKQT